MFDIGVGQAVLFSWNCVLRGFRWDRIYQSRESWWHSMGHMLCGHPVIISGQGSLLRVVPFFSLSALSYSLYRLLLELLELLFDKFKAVAQAHSVVLAHLQQIAVQCPGGAHEEGIKLYEQADVSAKIQTVLQVR